MGERPNAKRRDVTRNAGCSLQNAPDRIDDAANDPNALGFLALELDQIEQQRLGKQQAECPSIPHRSVERGQSFCGYRAKRETESRAAWSVRYGCAAHLVLAKCQLELLSNLPLFLLSFRHRGDRRVGVLAS